MVGCGGAATVTGSQRAEDVHLHVDDDRLDLITRELAVAVVIVRLADRIDLRVLVLGHAVRLLRDHRLLVGHGGWRNLHNLDGDNGCRLVAAKVHTVFRVSNGSP